MGFRDVLDLPVRTFWTLNGMITRVRAEEILDWLPAHASAMGGEGVQTLADNLKQRMGEPVIFSQEKMTKKDKAALAKHFG